MINTVGYLDNCYRLNLPSKGYCSDRIYKDFREIAFKQSILARQTSFKGILIFQPRFELKYRGVNYCTNHIKFLEQYDKL